MCLKHRAASTWREQRENAPLVFFWSRESTGHRMPGKALHSPAQGGHVPDSGKKSRKAHLAAICGMTCRSQIRNRLSNGAGRRNRTADTRIFSPLLYRLSYPGPYILGVPSGSPTRVAAVNGRCPGPLDDGDIYRLSVTHLVSREGLEPSTLCLKGSCSTS